MNTRPTAILGGVHDSEPNPWDPIFQVWITAPHTPIAITPFVPDGRGNRGGKKRNKRQLKKRQQSKRRNR